MGTACHEEAHVLTDRVHYFHYAEQYPPDGYGMVRYPQGREPWILAGRFPGSAEDTAEAAILACCKDPRAKPG